MLLAMRPGQRVLFLCIAGMVCEGLDLQSAGVAAAGIVQELQPDSRVLGWFFAASTVGLFIGAPIGGWFGDRLGRGRVVVASMVVFGVFSLATGLATSVGTLIAARFLTGLGLGGAMPNFIALASESSAVGKGGRSVALMFAGTPLGGAVASLVAAAVGPERWRWVFVVGGLLPLAVAALWQSARVDSPTTQAAAAVASSPRSSMVDVAFADGRAVPSLLLWTAWFASLLLLYLLLNWLPLLVVGLGLPTARAALAQVPFNLLGAIGAVVVGTRLDRRSRTWAIAEAVGALAASLFGSWHASTSAGSCCSSAPSGSRCRPRKPRSLRLGRPAIRRRCEARASAWPSAPVDSARSLGRCSRRRCSARDKVRRAC